MIKWAICRVMGGLSVEYADIPRDGTLLGGLFESLACLSVRTFAQAAGGRTYHLRCSARRGPR